MALGGFNAGSWSSAIPAASESIGLGDDRIRSLKTTLQSVLDSEHVWDNSAATIGQHRAGSARAFYGPQSSVSASDTSVVADGRMMIASDTSRLFGAGSGGTTLLGGPGILSFDSAIAFPQRSRWAIEAGTIVSNQSTHNVTFPSSGFSGIPFLMVSIYTQVIGSNDPARCFKLDTLSASGFSGQVILAENGDAGTAGIQWLSVGTRAL